MSSETNPNAESSRPYSQLALTDFVVAINVSHNHGESIAPEVLNFAMAQWPLVQAMNSKDFIDQKLRFHRGEDPERPGQTGIAKWYGNRGKPEVMPW